jgi:hypothetical protein
MSAVASGDRERLELARKTVPDELIMARVRESIASVDVKPIRLDGFRRTVAHVARVEVAAEQSAGSVRRSALPGSVASAPAAGSERDLRSRRSDRAPAEARALQPCPRGRRPARPVDAGAPLA